MVEFAAERSFATVRRWLFGSEVKSSDFNLVNDEGIGYFTDDLIRIIECYPTGKSEIISEVIAQIEL